MSCELDIGHGVIVRWDIDGMGITWRHPECRAWSWLRFAPDASSTGHRLASGGPGDLERFTVVGSLLCPGGCGRHGFITNGRWVPA